MADPSNIVATAQVDAATGGYAISALDAGTYDLEVSAAMYATQTESGFVVTAGEVNGGHDFPLTF